MARPHCFRYGGWEENLETVYVQFSDGSIYWYQNFTLEEWIEWRDAAPRGVYFNEVYRWSDVNYGKADLIPPGLQFTFYDPLGEP